MIFSPTNRDSRAKQPVWRHFALTLSLLLVAGLPLTWFLTAFFISENWVGPPPHLISGPLKYFLSIGFVAATWIGIAFLFRRRSTAGALGVCAMVSAGGFITFVLAFLIAFDWLPTNSGFATQWEPNIVTDETAFAKARAHAYGRSISSGNPGECVERHSWRLDEYGVRPHDNTLRAHGVWMLPWEEYGLPLRCFRSRYHFGWPRPDAKTFMEWFPRILVHLAIQPVPFMLNTAMYAACILVLVKGPRVLRWLRRAAAGRCVACGYSLTLKQDFCPECGRRIQPIDRLLVRSESNS